ncbi:hypothetical protein BNJ_00284 [Kaumoebavirus]|uniref:hypothetical protein n=1 Tax=Kaumoebavirus TaxID=1859492 RepID=UPI0009C1E13E|nr:hypothetical protein BNJ_00284 [Kaumoebavirus]ARA72107.1 hypothetical protein BNJ_00284 [Kaumoebavirus]
MANQIKVEVKIEDTPGWFRISTDKFEGNTQKLTLTPVPNTIRGYEEVHLMMKLYFRKPSPKYLNIEIVPTNNKRPIYVTHDTNTKKGANIFAINIDNGPCPMLEVIVKMGEQFLVAEPSPIIAPSYGGRRVHWSALFSDVKHVKYWIEERGEDPNVTDDNGVTPLHLAVWSEHYEVSKYLLSKGANPTNVDKKGKTPLDHAKESGDIKLIALLEAGVLI